MPNVTIREATAVEAADAYLLIEEYYQAVQVIARDDRTQILHYISDPQSHVLLAYDDAGPVGCILYRPLPQLGSAGEVKRLYVRPAFRKRGIAEKLLQALEQFATTCDVECLYLDTTDDLKAAIAFYERHGYVRCDRYNDNPQATIFMRKRLGAG
ncbi:MAG TPA: GNAT family N-acetyltransferase [Bryobacteraceae bacterium]|jgi:ribosomal protein S18 acetylase RimI-like enzyme